MSTGGGRCSGGVKRIAGRQREGERVGVGRWRECAGGCEVGEEHVLVCGVVLHEALGEGLGLGCLQAYELLRNRLAAAATGDEASHARHAAALAAVPVPVPMCTDGLRHAWRLRPLDRLLLLLLLGRPDDGRARRHAPLTLHTNRHLPGVNHKLKLTTSKQAGLDAHGDAGLVDGAWRELLGSEGEGAASRSLCGVRGDPGWEEGGCEVGFEGGLESCESCWGEECLEGVGAGEEGDCVSDGDCEAGGGEGHG